MNCSTTTFKDISEIHPHSPFFIYTNKISANGMNKHLRFLSYDHHKNEVVDVSDIVSKSFNKKCTHNGVLFSGTGIDAQNEYFDRFKDAYQTLTGKNFEGKLEKFILKDKKFVSKYVKEFLDLKENKLKYASEEQQNDAKFVYEAIKDCGCAVQYANKRLKNNKRIALAAIQDDNTALRYVGDKVKDDEHYVRLVMDNYPTGHLWASSRIIKAIGDNDPVKHLDSFILHQKLEQDISDKPAIKKTKI
jgi:Domain of unknown function (DUF4116)